MNIIYMTAKEAALALHISPSTVYRRVRNGLLNCTRDTGKIRVAVELPPVNDSADASTTQVQQESAPASAVRSTGSGQRELTFGWNDRRYGFLITWEPVTK